LAEVSKNDLPEEALQKPDALQWSKDADVRESTLIKKKREMLSAARR